MTVGRTAPVRTLDVDALFDCVAGASALVLAVSGGPDSMALMRLAARWTVPGQGRPSLHVATVDHGLRRESAAEAVFVGAIAAELSLPHAILPWKGAKPSTRIQESAREARYDLLAGHARAVGAAHVLTGHHADDQAETVLMRLGRGSGVTGLCGMRRETALADGITLVRPLLDLSKATLVAVCREAGEGRFIEDPSNSDPAFERVRLRRQAEASAALGLDTPTLLRLADRMRRADAALDDAAIRLEARLAPVRAPGVWSTTLAPVADAAPELLQRILRRAIAHVIDATIADLRYPIRLDRLESMADDLQAALAARGAFRATLAGAQIVMGADTTIRVTPEPPRRRGRPHVGARSATARCIKVMTSLPPRSLGK